MSFRRSVALFLLCALSACAASPRPDPQPPGAAAPVPLLLLSIDGLRADALGRGDTPTLDRLAAAGVRAQWMRPSYPVLTFPNHFTLVTGLRPDHHGVVHNSMKDAQLGRFRVADAAAARVSAWWQAEPLWTSARKAGLVTGVWAWPGAAAARDGVVPDYNRVFDSQVPLPERMQAVAGWLAAPAPQRARFVAVYLEQVDQAGHDYGPWAPQTQAAIRQVDAAIGELLATVERAGIVPDVVVVSDHGMAPVAGDHYMAVEDLASREEAEVVSVGQVVGLAPRPGFEAAVEARLLGRHSRYQCWRKADIPARLRYGTHPRVPPVLCQMDEGWNALQRATVEQRTAAGAHDRGSHGYDPDAPSMRAVFVARGPSFGEGVVLPPFDNVDVYPLLASLLGLPPRPVDGDPATLRPALRAP